jgi:uncharacterized membrane protein
MDDSLSRPRGTRRPTYDPDFFGRLAETVARFFGTGRYLAIQTVVVFIWIIFNIVAFTNHFDPYPFILLNLVFSTQAAYAAPFILLAQNRQTERDRVQAERDREMNARSLASLDFLARELAGVRLTLESKVDREDLEEVFGRLQATLESLPEHAEQARSSGA